MKRKDQTNKSTEPAKSRGFKLRKSINRGANKGRYGRPLGSGTRSGTGELSEHALYIRCTASELALIRRAAERANVAYTELVRGSALAEAQRLLR